jgi:hypothetical protein
MRLLAVLLVLVAFPAFGQTGSATLTCTPPTTYTNGNPIGAAPIGRGAAQGGPFNLESKTSSTCGTTFTGLAVGTHWFVATATVNSVESAFSSAASGPVLPIPNAPGALSVVVSVTVTVNP